MSYIRWFKDISKDDVGSVGGKNANLGEMYAKLSAQGVPVPNGFAITVDCYHAFINHNKLDKKIKLILRGLDVKNVSALAYAGTRIRRLLLSAKFPKLVSAEIVEAYKELSKQQTASNDSAADVAVRSSATAEDLPDASFAGQQESYLNVRGESELLGAVKKCLASLFTDRAISYREAQGYDHFAVALSVGVQQMVRSDQGAAGVIFTLDTESGFPGVILINSSYGLGEYVVKGRITPDQFYVFKDGLRRNLSAIIDRRLGSKAVKLISASRGTHSAPVARPDRQRFSLTDAEVIELSRYALQIEEHYGHPMDIEWAKDGNTAKIYIVQARSETVRAKLAARAIYETYQLTPHRSQILLEGTSVGQKIGQGTVRIINSPKQMKQFKAGEVLVTRLTDPDWEPVMRLAAAIITEEGGKTSHAAIVSRELGVPCIVGASEARKKLAPGRLVTVSCSEGEMGRVYAGKLPYEVERHELKNLPATRTKIMINVGDPERAFSLFQLPADGVGLAREEFIFTNFIKIHPLALVNYKKISALAGFAAGEKKLIDELTVGYKDKTQYLVDKLAQGVAFIAAAFYPRPVVIRFSDFKTNEYATLIGGTLFEPKEENPMLGWRGASRYYDPKYKAAFLLECAAIKKAREAWGLTNIIVMVPFCRTPEEGDKVLAAMAAGGLKRGEQELKVYVMCEIPSNVILAAEFGRRFDGFSIGSNDLTQLTLGVDRDSALVSHIYDERNLAVKQTIAMAIEGAHQAGRPIGICGQAPSDYPEMIDFLVQQGIDSISLNSDAFFKTKQLVAAAEKKFGVKQQRKSVSLTSAKPKFSHSRLVSLVGVIGLSLALLGATCQTTGPQTSIEDIKATVALEAAKAKAQARREFEEEKQKETREYSEDSFVKFNLRYPAKWQVNHGDKDISFWNGDSNNMKEGNYRFIIYYAPPFSGNDPDRMYTELVSASTGTWHSYDFRRLTLYNVEIVTTDFSLELYPKKYKKGDTVLTLLGDQDHFDEILNSITDFEIKK